jgi:hypothetical protein
MAEAKEPVGHIVSPDELLSAEELAEVTWPTWKTQLGNMQSKVVDWGREHPYWPLLVLVFIAGLIWYFKRKS